MKLAQQSSIHHPLAGATAPSRRRARRALAGWAIAIAAVCGVLPARSLAQVNDGVINREYPLKALFLYNFGGYVEWPSDAFQSPQQPFVIGVLGHAPVIDSLRDIATAKTVGGRPLVIQRFDSAAAVRPCQILFVARGVPPQERQLAIDKLLGHPVLIVGETDGFAHQGAAINFFVEANKIRFEVNLEAARRHQLKISSKLLALAKIVQTRDAASR